jgi:hypothetical protein
MSVSFKTIDVTKISDFFDFFLRHLFLDSNSDVKGDRNLGQRVFTVKKTFELCSECVLP